MNGEQITSFGTANYTVYKIQTLDNVNGNAIDLGRWAAGSEYLESYPKVSFIDGTIAAHTDFGKFDTNNTWITKEYGGGIMVIMGSF